MKAIVFVLFAIFALCFAVENPLASVEEVIADVNSNPKSLYRAGHNKFSTMNDEEVKKFLLGTIIKPLVGVPVKHHNATIAVPDSFDARTQWPNCIHAIRNQQQCGSCWAFAGTEVLSDRFCIASNGKVNIILSPQDLVSCDNSDYGCQGGYLQNEWQYMVNSGVVPDDCFPYVSGSGQVPACPATCPGTGAAMSSVKHYASKYYSVGSASIQQEVMTNGPVEAAFYVYRDFMQYKSGVYHHTSGAFLGGHAVKIIGWGVSSGTPYWIIANSWGTTWGMNGFFWMLRGKNECGIESQVITGTPKV
jgi:cathepsin B